MWIFRDSLMRLGRRHIILLLWMKVNTPCLGQVSEVAAEEQDEDHNQPYFHSFSDCILGQCSVSMKWHLWQGLRPLSRPNPISGSIACFGWLQVS